MVVDLLVLDFAHDEDRRGLAGGGTMIDREKVIKGLECCMSDGSECYDSSNGKCPYYKYDVPTSACTDDLFYDVYVMLKEQEPNEDWISRKRLRDEIQYYIDDAGWGDEVNKVLGWCLEFIDNQEAVKWND